MNLRQNYYSVIAEAISDISEHGFTSQERIAYWQRKIREAAEAFLGSTAAMEETLRESLAAVYRRLIDSGRIIEHHPGIGRFTLEKVKPHLRAELDRRIMASANLIKLNREQAVAKTLQRFSGWSTSIPAGGSDLVKKRKEKDNIRKPLAQVKFEYRRVLIDQGHKLTASLNDILAKDGGAIAAAWRHVHQAGYDGRPDHIARDGKIFAIRDSWAAKQGLIRKGPNGYTDEIEQVAELPYCRCTYQYKYNLRDMPDEFLTAKGRETLAEARRKIMEMT